MNLFTHIALPQIDQIQVVAVITRAPWVVLSTFFHLVQYLAFTCTYMHCSSLSSTYTDMADGKCLILMFW